MTEYYPYLITLPKDSDFLELSCVYGFPWLVKHYLNLMTRLNCFLFASKNGHLEVVKVLLQTNYDPYAAKEACKWACINGYLEIVDLFMSTGLTFQPIFLSQCRFSPEILEYFLKQLETYNLTDDLNEIANNLAGTGKLESLQVIIKFRPELLNNPSLIGLASEYGHVWIVEYLLNCGADPDFVEGYCLTMATANGHDDVVDLLTDRKE